MLTSLVIKENGFKYKSQPQPTNPPGDRAHRLPVVLQLEPLHHLRHHDVQLQPGKALPDARPVKECFLLSDNLTSTWLHPTSLNLSAFLVVISEDDHQQRIPNPNISFSSLT